MHGFCEVNESLSIIEHSRMDMCRLLKGGPLVGPGNPLTVNLSPTPSDIALQAELREQEVATVARLKKSIRIEVLRSLLNTTHEEEVSRALTIPPAASPH